MYLQNFLYTSFPIAVLLVLTFYIFSFLNLLFRNFVSPYLFSKRKQIRKFDNWIIITGATDGIGKSFAELLAIEGYNLVLISRNIDKLEKVKSEILFKCNIEIKLIAVDFTKIDIYDKIENGVKNLDVGLLINNVGMTTEFPDYLTSERNSDENIINLINCNCVSTARMTRLILKLGMADKGGFVLNISSATGILPIGLFSIYGSTKSFINGFTRIMEAELRYSNVTFQTVTPFYVATKMAKFRPGLFIPSPRSCANNVLNKLGTCSITYGCFSHEFLGWLSTVVPQFIVDKILHYNVTKIRQKAIRKLMKRV